MKQCKNCNWFPHCHLRKKLDCDYYVDRDGKEYHSILEDKYNSTHNELLDVLDDVLDMEDIIVDIDMLEI